MTPFEKLMSLANVEQYLNDGVTLADLCQYATAKTDAQAATELKQAKQKLFSNIFQKTA